VFAQLFVGQGERHADADRDLFGGRDQQLEVSPEQCPLRQHGQRRARVGQRLDDAGHQAIAALGSLVGIGVGA
jgi:hypothetical protein